MFYVRLFESCPLACYFLKTLEVQIRYISPEKINNVFRELEWFLVPKFYLTTKYNTILFGYVKKVFCYNSLALNINFIGEQTFQNTKLCRKCEGWTSTEIKRKKCFLRQSWTKYPRQIYKIKQSFYGKCSS